MTSNHKACSRLFDTISVIIAIAVTGPWAESLASDVVIETRLIHLRSGALREWAEFPEAPQGQRVQLKFASQKNATEQTLFVRQQDVKQAWTVSLNGKKLGALTIDENDMVVTFAIPPGGLLDGDNSLIIEPPTGGKSASDDIRVGEIKMADRAVREALREATLNLIVYDSFGKHPLPCRITVLNEQGAMQTLGAESNDQMAVRPGIVFTSTGHATIGVPAGRYMILAGRGFEYSLARLEISVEKGATVSKSLVIGREVPTEGFVACDPHVHTLTHSGHGDATIHERMITLAGEGIELPIACDHNKHIDYEEAAVKMSVRRFFTPVMGNEVTTPRGHFNIFPIAAGARVVDHKQTDWKLLFDDIEQTPGVRIAIINHARDVHSGIRPFEPSLHNPVVGENLDGWPMRFNAMEVINSGATQTDALQLFHDWMRLLNRGLKVTPIGSSDSHDVGRHFVGQGRTYIRCDDQNVAKINVDHAMDSLANGRVMVSYGLMAELTVNDQFHSGDLVSWPVATEATEKVKVNVRVLGPRWVKADRVLLFANGQLLHDEPLPPEHESLPMGVRGQASWTMHRPSHDVHLVAIAIGPGIDGLHWKTAKPYQPTSSEWEPHVIGCSGAVWLDADGDGKPTSARAYAERRVRDAEGDFDKLIELLRSYDSAVASQAAHLFMLKAPVPGADFLEAALAKAPAAVQRGFREYLNARRDCDIARSTRDGM